MEYRAWEDYYNPYDYLGAADKEALEYLRAHPEANKRAVKQAAENFALVYEHSDSLRQKPFKMQLLIAMKTADYNSRKTERKGKMDAELKQAIIRDYQTGMTPVEIAERYGLHPTTTKNNISNWAKKGLLELRTAPKKNGETEIAGACKEEPPKVEFYENGFPVDYETPEPPEETEKAEPEEEPEKSIDDPIEDDGADFIATLEQLEEFVFELFPGSYVLECFASNVKNFAGIQFVDGTGRAYLLKLEEKTEEDRDDF